MDYQHILVCFMFTCSLGSARDVKYVLKGQEITLGLSTYRQPTEIYWIYEVNDIVFFDGKMETVEDPYKNRITLNKNSAVLTIKNATYEDSGNYDQEVRINTKLYHNAYEIEVIDKVSKPKIRCKMIDRYQATLVCSTESKHSHLLKFKWRSDGNEQTGPNLTITLKKFLNHEVYMCDVGNPLTNEIAAFTVKDCLSGGITVAEKVVIFLSIIAVVLIGVFIFWGWKFYKKRQERRKRDERRKEVLLYEWSISSLNRKEIMEIYNISNPNDFWFLGSHDKLKEYGITITACKDIFSERILWMKADNANSDPAVFLNHFLDTVTRIGGCPRQLIAKPSLHHITKTQTFLRRNHTDYSNEYQSVISTSNSTSHTWLHVWTYWKYCFETLRDSGLFTGNDLDKNLVQFCFFNIIQDQLDEFVRSNNRTQSESAEDHIYTVLPEDIDVYKTQCTPRGRYPCDETLYKRFERIMTENGWNVPADEIKALEIYAKLRKKMQENNEAVIETCIDEEQEVAGLLK
ncbi:uncharacterized protein LOC133658905 isoform X2 [Entelurus aequoreus]|uniref:uncharacterized protein LOC133658905 isoform X2 n=1 Tax=Entelurus aequoreus TaxID=161455 RepID=UPI002B1D173D|nr:uncharacterized protein LOC133658905 isoform X2 [Entelurus aequoreus]